MTRNRSFETHAGWGAAVALAAFVAGASVLIAFVIALAFGVIVEAVQWVFPNTGSASIDDIIYTGVGALAGVGWVFFLTY